MSRAVSTRNGRRMDGGLYGASRLAGAVVWDRVGLRGLWIYGDVGVGIKNVRVLYEREPGISVLSELRKVGNIGALVDWWEPGISALSEQRKPETPMPLWTENRKIFFELMKLKDEIKLMYNNLFIFFLLFCKS